MTVKETIPYLWIRCILASLLWSCIPVMDVAAEQGSRATPLIEIYIRNGKTWKAVPIKSVLIETPLMVNCKCGQAQAALSLVVTTDLGVSSPLLEVMGAAPDQSVSRLCPDQIPISASFGPIHLNGSLKAESRSGITEYQGTLKEEGASPSIKVSVSRLVGTMVSECPLEESQAPSLETASTNAGATTAAESSTVSSVAAAATLPLRFGPSNGKTRFAKLAPKLSNPIKVLITKDGGFFPGSENMEKVGPLDSDPGYSLTSLENNSAVAVPKGSVYFFPFNRDVLVTIQTPLTITKQIGIYGGRNVVVQGIGGGYITKKLDPRIPAACDQTLPDCRKKLADYTPDVTGVLRFDSPKRSVVVRDLKIDVNGDTTDAIVVRQNPNTFSSPKEFAAFGGIDIFVYNFGAYNIGGAGPGLHGDIVQLQNGTYRNMFFENIEGSTGYQGFFLPQRPQGNPNLCSIINQQKPGSANETWEVMRCFSPIKVKGTAFFENVVLRPIDPAICPNCPIPYRGLYSKDQDVYFSSDLDPVPRIVYKAPSYETQLQNVTFFTDPRSHPRNKVSLYVMPQPRNDTTEGTINMTVSTNGTIKGRLTVISTNYGQARDALLKSGWQSRVDSGASMPYRDAPEIACDQTSNLNCSATYLFGTRKIVLIVERSKTKSSGAELLVVGARY